MTSSRVSTSVVLMLLITYIYIANATILHHETIIFHASIHITITIYVFFLKKKYLVENVNVGHNILFSNILVL
jgi:hypothetical protein